jgi:predicted CoA-substrate-specific enzyme activase
MICAGIDAGSRTIKVLLLDAGSLEVLAEGVDDQGVEQDMLAQQLLDRLLADRGLCRSDIGRSVATRYGRRMVRIADDTITEITCQAWGVRHRAPQAATIIDIGGQDSKLLRIGKDGNVRDFVMNDRCAAGTGRLLEVLATRLAVRLQCLGDIARNSRAPAAWRDNLAQSPPRG